MDILLRLTVRIAERDARRQTHVVREAPFLPFLCVQQVQPREGEVLGQDVVAAAEVRMGCVCVGCVVAVRAGGGVSRGFSCELMRFFFFFFFKFLVGLWRGMGFVAHCGALIYLAGRVARIGITLFPAV